MKSFGNPGPFVSRWLSLTGLAGTLALVPVMHAQAQTNCAPVPAGIVSWWAAEGNANDSADGNNGILQGTVVFAAGKVGQAFNLNGSNGFISFAASSNLNVGAGPGLSFECWIRPDDLSGGHAIAEWNNGTGGVGVHLWISIPDLGGLGSIFGNIRDTAGGDHYFATAPNVLTVGNFQHIALTYDRTSGTAKLYYNGTAAATQNLGVLNPQTTYGFYLGKRASGDASAYYKGLLDEPSLYGRALTDTEILGIYNAGSSGKCSAPPPQTNCAPVTHGLVSSWKGEGNANDSVDSNNGVLLNGLGFTSGEVGQAFSFDGIDDRILVSNSPSLNFGPGQNFSIEAWIRPLPSTTDFDIMSVVDKRTAPDLTHSQGYEFVLSSGRIACRLSDSLSDNGSPFISSGPDLRDGNFHHVALTVARGITNGGRLYADGQVVLNFDASVEPGDLSNSDPLRIGFNAVASISSPFKGQIDEVTLYSRALDISEIQSIYNAGSLGKCPIGPPPTNCVPPAQGIVSWWAAEGNASDVFNINNGTLYNGANFATGEVGQSFSFDGVSAHVRVPDSPSLHFTNALTIEAWVYPTNFGNYEQIVSKWDAPGGTLGQKSYALQIQPDGRLNMAMGATGDDSITGAVISTNPVSLNQWTHVAGTYDGTTIKVYINGAYQNQSAYSQGIYPGTHDLGIGGTVGGVPLGQAAYCMAGRIDEPAVYGRALSGGEIAAIYNAGSAGKCRPSSPPTNCVPALSGLVSWWPAEGNAVDVVGGNSGVLSTNVTFAPGKVGQSFNFDGITASVQVPDAPSLRFTSAMTIEAWIYPRQSGGGRFREIVSKWEGGSDQRSYTCNIYPDGRFTFSLAIGGSSSVNNVFSIGTIPTNTWTHVAGIYNGSSLLIYINGQLNNSAPSTNGIFPGTAPLIIGSTLFSGSFFDGLIDEASVYNRALSTSEIAAIYNAGSAGKCAPTAVGPSITSQPQSLTVNAGATATFSVTATGTGPLNYQWRKGTNAIGGATGSAYTILNVQSSDAGNYSVIVSNAISSVTSSNALLTVLPPGTNCAPVSSGLVGWWKAEGNTLDQVGVNNGTLVGNTTYGPGRVGQAFVFDGSGDGVALANNANLQIQDLTIEAWIQRNSTNRVSFDFNGGEIFSYGYGGYVLGLKDDGHLFLSRVGISEVLGQSINDLGFHHVAVTKNGTNVVFYLDGVASAGSLFTDTFTFSSPPAIGARGDTLQNSFIGLVDEVSVYNRPLSIGEIASIYNVGSLGKCPAGPQPTNCVPAPSGLVSWWEGEGNGIDIVNQNNGTLLNGLAFTNAEVGLGFNFDGVDDELLVSNSPTLNFGAGVDFSIEGWIKAFPNSVDFGVNTIMDKRFNQTIGYEFTLESGRPHLRLSSTPGSDGFAWTTGPDLRDGVFHHVAVSVTRSSTNGMVFYVDGAVVGTADPTSQQGSLSNSAPLVIGEHSAGYHTSFDGVMDELSLYARALTGAEIQAIFNAGGAGKCTGSTSSPFIVSQPQNQSVTVGATATFSVGVTGSSPLSYQWYFNGSNAIAGATTASLTIPNAQLANSGLYSVAVTNPVGFALSSNARLTVNPGPTLLRVGDASVASGGTVTVPVLLTANGTENAMQFSLSFAPARLTYVSTTLANGAGATFFVNESQTATGRLGMALALPAGSTFPPGTQEAAEVTFTAAVVTNTTLTPITFVDQPIVRQVSDAGGHAISATYTGGTVSIARVAYEADVAPRPNGDGAVTVTDWVIVGRFAAHLDTPTPGSEFQRADCAPRADLGDGRISITDWVQAGRYVAGLDPLTPAGGPTSQVSAVRIALKSIGPKLPNSRQILAGSTVLNQGQSGTVSINLRAAGNENALGFTLAFDPTQLAYVDAQPGAAAAGATLNVNTDQAGSGLLGFALALSGGSHFGGGSNELVKVKFQASLSATNSLALSFVDDVIYREVSDITANELTADYVNGTIVVNPLPALRIWAGDQGIGLAWPSWATNFVLQENSADLASSANWTKVTATTSTTNNETSVTVPINAATKFYRLLKQ